MVAVTRCDITGNPCGTDTWAAGYVCPCAPCRDWVARNPPHIVVVEPENAKLDRLQQDVVGLLETALARAKDGQYIGAMLIFETMDGYDSTWTPSYARHHRLGLLELLKNYYLHN